MCTIKGVCRLTKRFFFPTKSEFFLLYNTSRAIVCLQVHSFFCLFTNLRVGLVKSLLFPYFIGEGAAWQKVIFHDEGSTGKVKRDFT